MKDMPVIDKVSRKDLIEEGSLIVVDDELLKEVGIKFPAAVTSGANALLEDMPEYESFEGRAYDMLYMFVQAVKGTIQSKTTSTSLGEEMKYEFILNDATFDGEPKEVTIKTIIGPGDNFEPVLTFMLPEED